MPLWPEIVQPCEHRRIFGYQTYFKSKETSRVKTTTNKTRLLVDVKVCRRDLAREMKNF